MMKNGENLIKNRGMVKSPLSKKVTYNLYLSMVLILFMPSILSEKGSFDSYWTFKYTVDVLGNPC